jgi:tyrosinase
MANEPRVRRDVQSLIDEGPSGMKVLEEYATAIAAAKALDADENVDPSDPRSWRFQAAIHGYGGVPATIDDPNHFSSCRHFSWFFLAWHRVYLFYFERMIQHHLQDDTWSLPYWDYTKVVPNDDSSRKLPAPFRTPRFDNELFTPLRDPDVNNETSPEAMGATRCDARGALEIGTFAFDTANPEPSFGGGIVEDIDPNSGPAGALEGSPHGSVHVLVGGGPGGLMFDFNTAGLDPIFWLHHNNLDRLWDVWISKWGADALPQDDVWLNTEFGFFDSDGSRKSKKIRDILVSSDLGYVYESIDQPAGTRGPDPLSELAAGAPAPMPEPELLGAASGIDFSSRSSVDIELAPNDRVAALAAGEESLEEPTRWFLRVEDVAGSAPKAPMYDVYLNLPDSATATDRPDLRAGSITSFGLPQASERAGQHGGVGITQTFDVTDVIAQLIAGDDTTFDPSKVTVHVVPVGLKGEVDDGGDVRAGRISIYAG